MKKICFLAAVPVSVDVFLTDIIQQSSKMYKVKVVSHPSGKELLSKLNAEYVPLVIERKPAPYSDLIALIKLIYFFRKERFDLVHSITPKTGLLTMLAACITLTPIRVHTFTGQVWLNMHGYKRFLLKFLDKLIVACSTHILVDSPSQRDFLIKEGVLSSNQYNVFGKGSICGVDTDVFKFNLHDRKLIRDSLFIDDDKIIILYMSRLTRQKGILELAEAFSRVADKHANVYLYVIGSEENVSFSEILEKCGQHKNRVLRLNYTNIPASHLSASDILCLPSHMEGFGQVLVNASACGIPIVASRIYGITDAVDDNVTGLLYRDGDIEELFISLLKLIEDKSLRTQMGVSGRERVLNYFDKNIITKMTLDFYEEQLRSV